MDIKIALSNLAYLGPALIIMWVVSLVYYLLKKKYNPKFIIWFLLLILLIFIIGFSLFWYYNYQIFAATIGTDYEPVARYFYQEKILRHGSDLIASLVFSLLLTTLFYIVWKLTKGLVIDGLDVVLLFLAMLSSQWPNMLVFLVMVFVSVLLINIILIVIGRRPLNNRIIITPAIPVAVILSLFFGNMISNAVGLSVIQF
ncbi:hypothetical protein ACFL04_01420 [Patescibacteria group bacterium]